MPYGDDLDARFHELVAQFSEEERRRMRAAASKGAGPRRRRRIGPIGYAVAAVLAVVVAALLVVAFRPGLVSPAPEPPTEAPGPVLRALPSAASGDMNAA